MRPHPYDDYDYSCGRAPRYRLRSSTTYWSPLAYRRDSPPSFPRGGYRDRNSFYPGVQRTIGRQPGGPRSSYHAYQHFEPNEGIPRYTTRPWSSTPPAAAGEMVEEPSFAGPSNSRRTVPYQPQPTQHSWRYQKELRKRTEWRQLESSLASMAVKGPPSGSSQSGQNSGPSASSANQAAGASKTEAVTESSAPAMPKQPDSLKLSSSRAVEMPLDEIIKAGTSSSARQEPRASLNLGTETAVGMTLDQIINAAGPSN